MAASDASRRHVAIGIASLAALGPFLAVVGGYLLVQGLMLGDFRPGTGERAYLAFETGHGVTSGSGWWAALEGLDDVHSLFGTGEENGYSVINAARRNPRAFASRLADAVPLFAQMAVTAYGGTLGIVVLALAIGGVVRLVRARQYIVALAALLWIAPTGVYLVFCCREGYFILPWFAVLTLAAIGLDDLLSLAQALVLRGATETTSALLLRSAAVIALVGGALVLHNPFPSPRPVMLGATGEELSASFLAQTFERGTVIGSFFPLVPWMAKLEWESMIIEPFHGGMRRFHIADEEALAAWLARTQVRTIYLDVYMRDADPVMYDVIQRQIGRGAREIFSPADIFSQYSPEAVPLFHAYRIVRFDQDYPTAANSRSGNRS